MKPSAIVAAALCAVSLACFGDRADNFAALSDTTSLVLGAGDLLITTTDSNMQLGPVGDTVPMQFSEKMRTKLRADLDTTHLESNNGFGAAIERAVKRKVGAMLGRRLVRLLADIDVSSRATASSSPPSHPARLHLRQHEERQQAHPRVVRARDARRFVDAAGARRSGGERLFSARATAAPSAVVVLVHGQVGRLR
jgi:hypothetical protein